MAATTPNLIPVREGDDIDIPTRDVLPYTHIKSLGMGSSSFVEMVRDTTSGQVFAHKVFRRYHGPNTGKFRRDVRNEIEILRRLSSHPHIIRVFATYTCGRDIGIIFTPVADSGDLANYLQNILDFGNPPTIEQCAILKRAFGCLASGLAFIHKKAIRHKDIKPQNILIHKGIVIFTDFGIALDASLHDTTTTIGTPEAFTRRYCAPEVANWAKRSRKSDIFSLGCVFIEMLAVLQPNIKLGDLGMLAYYEVINDLRDVLNRSKRVSLRFNELIRVCFRMLEPDPEHRISAEELLNALNLLRKSKENAAFEWFCDSCTQSVLEEQHLGALSSTTSSTDQRQQETEERSIILEDVGPLSQIIGMGPDTGSVIGTRPTILGSDSAIDITSNQSALSSSAKLQRVRVSQDMQSRKDWIEKGYRDDDEIHVEDGTVRHDSSTSEDSFISSDQINETEITEYDYESVVSEDSESSTFDPGPQQLPPDLQPDEHVVNTTKWISKLESMEKDIIHGSSYFRSLNLAEHSCSDSNACIPMHDAIRANIRRMKEAGYFTGSLTVVVGSSARHRVASLIRIPENEIDDVSVAIVSQDFGRCLHYLHCWGFEGTCAKIQQLDIDCDRIQAAAAAISWLLDVAVVSFSGAHLERFDEKYLCRTQSMFTFSCTPETSLVLRRRSLKCLDAYLHGRQVWVFEEIDSSVIEYPSSEDALYLSTTMSDFGSVWGPLWVTHIRDSDQKNRSNTETPVILRYNVGLGWVIPWRQRHDEPPVLANEVFAHWTNDVVDLLDSEPFPESTPDSRLLIGGALRLSVNEDCALSACLSVYTSHLQNQNRLRFGGVRKPVTERDSQTVTVQLSALSMASVGYQEQYRIREGFLLREQLLAMWTYEPGSRNPAILSHFAGVEVSACTENARRRRLVHILGSSTMLNYLDTFMLDWEHEESKGRYLQALASPNIRAFEALYISELGLRKDLGRAIAVCLHALHHTGSLTGESLHALWCPSRGETWTATFNYWDQHWVGLLKDTISSCAFAVLTPQCLVMADLDLVSECQNQHRGAMTGVSSQANLTTHSFYRNHHSVFETAVIINNEAEIPKGLKYDGKRWKINRLQLDDEFDLGESGRVRFIRPISSLRSGRSKGALMRWSPNSLGREAIQQLRERVLKLPRSPCHREQVLDENHVTKSLQVHIMALW